MVVFSNYIERYANSVVFRRRGVLQEKPELLHCCQNLAYTSAKPGALVMTDGRRFPKHTRLRLRNSDHCGLRDLNCHVGVGPVVE
jgi:hypothetical protein